MPKKQQHRQTRAIERRIQKGELAPDGLMWPAKSLTTYHGIMRKACIGWWGRNISQMAEDLGLSRQTCVNYVIGNTRVPMDAMQALADAMGTTIETLLEGNPAYISVDGWKVAPDHPKYEILKAVAREMAPDIFEERGTHPAVDVDCTMEPASE